MADKSIGVRFVEAIEFLRRRLNVTSAEFDALLHGADYEAVAMADGALEAVVNDLIGAVLEQIEAGGTYDDFKARYDVIVKDSGWSFGDASGWHSRLIYRMQTGSAYLAGRWEQIQRQIAARPNTQFYLRYVTVGDERVRHTHAEWEGLILPAQHPFWLTHYPPNGFNCRCRVQLLEARDLRRNDWNVTDDNDPRLSVPPDDGFAGNVGIAALALRDATKVPDAT